MNIEHQLDLQASPATVYNALATPEGIQGWWCKECEIATAVGGLHTLNFVKGDRTVVMKFAVAELIPGEKVAWTCTENGNPAWIGTTLTFEIKAEGAGSTLSFVHGNFSEQWKGSPPYTMTVDGWVPFMNSLQAYCETEVGQPM